MVFLGTAVSGGLLVLCGLVGSSSSSTAPVTQTPWLGLSGGALRQLSRPADEVRWYARGTWRRLARQVKVYSSSKLEGCLLRATRPDGAAVDEQGVEQLLHATEHFPSIRSYHKGCEPTRVMVRKIWKKCNEGDWRTASKGLYVLHRLLRDCGSDDDAEALALEFRRFSSKALVNGADHLELPVDLMPGEGGPERAWLERYSAYLLFRSSEGSADLLGPLAITSVASTSPFRRRLASTLAAANRLMSLALRCQPASAKLQHPVVRQCMACVVKDVLERVEALRRDDLVGLEDEAQDDLITQVLLAEAFSHRHLLPQVDRKSVV